MIHQISLIVTLSALWLLLSGHYNPLLLSFGAISVALVAWIAHRMDLVDGESHPLHLSGRLPGYLLWLLKEIAVSNIDVVRRIVAPRRFPIRPAMSQLPLAQLGDVAQVIYANSITLTPGTITVAIDNPAANGPAADNDQATLWAHALHESSLDDLAAGAMLSRVKKLEPGA